MPQACFWVPGLHMPLLAQHPVGHDSASQTHDPETHRWPDPQAFVPPQRQAPVAEQPSAVVESQATHVPPP